MEMTVNKNGTAQHSDQLSEIVGKAEDLLGRLGDSNESAVMELRQRVQATIVSAKNKLTELQTQTQDAINKGVKNTDAYVHANPWTAIAIAATVGALVGALVARRG